MVNYIQNNYRDCDLIDFEGEHKKDMINNNSSKEYKEQLIGEDRVRHWRFIAETIILNSNQKLNRHQNLVKNLSTLN